MRVTLVPILTDNYSFILQPCDDMNCWLVDPAAYDPMQATIEEQELTLQGILITHHHWDHVRDLPLWRKNHPHIPVFGPTRNIIEGLTHGIDPHDPASFPDLGVPLQVFTTPGHTLDHLSYYFPDSHDCFVGDTLFHTGCGRMFEGTAQQFWHSLTCLRNLPAVTRLWFGHEYTRSNLDFALSLWPHKKELLDRRHNLAPCTCPTTVAEQIACNPFLWCDGSDPVFPSGRTASAKFAWLRHAKDNN